MSKAKKTESVAEILARKKANAKGKTKINKTNKKTTTKKAGVKKPAPKKAGKIVEKKSTKQTRNNFDNKKKINEIHSDLVGLRHPQGYLEFIDFLATPPHLREHETQAEFAKSIQVSENTLTDWKKRVGFYEDLNERRRNIVDVEMLATSVTALHKRILKKGKGADVKVLWQIAGRFEEKSVVENKPPIKQLSVERKEQILKNIKNWKKK